MRTESNASATYFQYIFSRPLTTRSADVFRLTVMSPLTGLVPSMRRRQVADGYKKLFQLYLERVRQLAAAGWTCPVHQDKSGLMYTCKPYGAELAVLPRVKLFTCDRVVFCPWCYGRYVGRIYRRVLKRSHADTQLVICSSSRQVGTGSSLTTEVTMALAQLRKVITDNRCLLKVSSQNRRKKRPKLPVGSYYRLTVAPDMSPSSKLWWLTTTLITQIEKGKTLDHLPAQWGTQTYRADLATSRDMAVALSLSYPVGLFFGNVGMAAEALRTCSTGRLSATTGVFRGKKSSLLKPESGRDPSQSAAAVVPDVKIDDEDLDALEEEFS